MECFQGDRSHHQPRVVLHFLCYFFDCSAYFFDLFVLAVLKMKFFVVPLAWLDSNFLPFTSLACSSFCVLLFWRANGSHKFLICSSMCSSIVCFFLCVPHPSWLWSNILGFLGFCRSDSNVSHMFPLFLLHVLLFFALTSLTFLYTDCTFAIFLAENNKQQTIRQRQLSETDAIHRYPITTTLFLPHFFICLFINAVMEFWC